MTIRLLVVDDHLLIREGLVRALRNTPDFEVVGEAGNGFDAVEAAHRLQPDVVLMDLYLPGLDGIAATRLIMRDLQTHVILLTASGNEEDILDAIRAGAKGYVLKDDSMSTVIQQIRKVAEGRVALSEEMASKLISGLAKRPKATSMHSDGPIEDLTEREKEVLALVARGMANKEIAYTLHISENTARAHIRSLMQKLNVDNRTQLAVYGVREGIIWKADQQNARGPEAAGSRPLPVGR